MITGTTLYGVLVSDRERPGIGYALHAECLATLRALLPGGDGDGFTTPQRFVELSPATSDPSARCDLASCGKPLGESA